MPVWAPKADRGQSARCAALPSVYAPKFAEALPGCCEFATGIVFVGCEGRNCAVSDCYCPTSRFQGSQSFRGLPACGKEKLAAEQS